MAVKIGSTTASAIKLGTTDIAKAYQGTILVWDTSSDGGEDSDSGFIAPTLQLIDDDSYGSYIYQAIVEHATYNKPSEVGLWRIHLTGRVNESHPYIPFNDVYINIDVTSTGSTVYRATTSGFAGQNNIDMRALYYSQTRRFVIYHGNGTQISNLSINIQPRTNLHVLAGNASNTLTGIFLAEDG